MKRRNWAEAGPLFTLTHARLRVAQGDLEGAREVLRALLRAHPRLAEARRLLNEIDGRAERPLVLRAADSRRALSRQGSATAQHRIERLEAWMRRISRGFGADA